MKNKKYKKIIKFFVCVVLLFVIIHFLLFYQSSLKNKEIKTVDFKLYSEQNSINKELLNYYNDDKYTFNSPKIIKNPYKRSPLTALIIFKTQNDVSIKVYINDVFVTEMEKSKKHAIPIIGLIEDYENVIKLVYNKEEKTVKINTEKQNVKYEYESSDKNKSAIFFANIKSLLATTSEGIVNWIINGEYNNFEISKSKNIYYIDEEQRIVESDFLGKIKKIYLLPTTIDYHYLTELSNNNYLIITNDSIIMEIDYESGKIIKEYNVKEILLNVDKTFNVPAELHINYIDYHESEGYMIISIRGLDTIVKYDTRQKKFEWILTENPFFGDEFVPYKLNLTYGRYPNGQHTPYLVDNKLYVFNNDYKKYEGDGKNESSASIYEINGKNIKEIYTFKNGVYSYAYGNFNVLKNNNKLINFGISSNMTNFESKIYEINNLNETVQSYIFGIPTYRAFEDSFYNQYTNNYDLENTQTIKNKNMDLKKYLVNVPRFKLKTASKNGLLISVEDSKIVTNIDTFSESFPTDEIKFLFIGLSKSYCFPYKVKNSNYTFNINNFLIKIKGKYAIYAIINGEYYDTNMVVNIK